MPADAQGFRKLLIVAAAVLPVAQAPAAWAGNLITFGGQGMNHVLGNDNGTGTTTITRDAPVTVDSIVGGGGPFSAFFALDATSFGPASLVLGGPEIAQRFSGTFCITSLSGCGGINYLSGSFTDAVFGEGQGLTLTAAQPPDVLTLTSSVIPAADLVPPNAFSLAFTNVSPAVSIAPDGSLASFTASSTGTASAANSAGPSGVSTPEPTSLALLSAGMVGLGLLRRRVIASRLAAT